LSDKISFFHQTEGLLSTEQAALKQSKIKFDMPVCSKKNEALEKEPSRKGVMWLKNIK
jgi:hypothetical protein